ncbi:MAG: hypothetical protein KIT25_07935 [Enhydrobacter sp.]|nr:MAG: hypothetical protein KIT25_07935 [Enhydrobacter sp.]
MHWRMKGVASLHPFVVGHCATGLVVGACAGAYLPEPWMIPLGAAAMGVAAAASSAVCAWRPGLDAAVWKLVPAAAAASPLMMLALGFMAADWECLAGRHRGWDCVGAAIAVLVAGLSLVPPLGGMLWRWWRRR